MIIARWMSVARLGSRNLAGFGSFLVAVVVSVNAHAWDEPISAERINLAIHRSIELLEASTAISREERQCFTCHHQAVPTLCFIELHNFLELQREREPLGCREFQPSLNRADTQQQRIETFAYKPSGSNFASQQVQPVATTNAERDFGHADPVQLTIDEQNLASQLEHTFAHLRRGESRYRDFRGQGGGVDTAGYALFTLAESGYPGNETIAAVSEYILNKQDENGRWRCSSQRPPSEQSHFKTTFLAIRALSAYPPEEKAEEVAQAINLAAAWLAESTAEDTEDSVFRLLAFTAITPTTPELEEQMVNEAARLLEQQHVDGGWSQLASLNSDAYATGTALYALSTANQLAPQDEAYQSGLAFLLSTQQPDGSWHVVTRSDPFQSYFESGFPYGEDQFISTTASSWATLALIRALPSSWETSR